MMVNQKMYIIILLELVSNLHFTTLHIAKLYSFSYDDGPQVSLLL